MYVCACVCDCVCVCVSEYVCACACVIVCVCVSEYVCACSHIWFSAVLMFSFSPEQEDSVSLPNKLLRFDHLRLSEHTHTHTHTHVSLCHSVNIDPPVAWPLTSSHHILHQTQSGSHIQYEHTQLNIWTQ